MRALLLAIAAWPALTAAGPREDVLCAEVAFSRSAESGDLSSFRSFIDPDARFVGSEVLHGPEAVAAAWAPFFSQDGPRIAWRPRLVEVLASGDLALTRGPYRLRTRDGDGRAVERWGTFNSVWRLGEDGSWRVVFDAGAPPVETVDDESKALLEAPLPGCTREPAAHTPP